jgi:heme O synthase-like polyprenyltransferase
MKKYFNHAIILECICITYTIIHNCIHISQQGMFAAAFLIMAISLYLFWQCFTNKSLSKQQKYIGLFFASIPLLCIIGFGILMMVYTKIAH